MANYILGILGIVVSLLLFLIGYRQTVGAKKERAAAANAQLERIVVRLIATEDTFPTAAELERLIQGKAIDNRVPPESLMSVNQLMAIVSARISESDLISSERRKTLLEEIAKLFAAMALTPTRQKARLRRMTSFSQPVIGLALIASLLGALIVELPSLERVLAGTGGLNLKASLLTALTSLFATLIVSFYLRLRSSQIEVASSRTEYRGSQLFERRVLSVLNRLTPAHVTTTPNSSAIDYVVTHTSRKIGIIARNWESSPPSSYVRSMFRKWLAAGKDMGLDEIIIVTPDTTLITEFPKEQGLRLTSLKELPSMFE